MTTSYSFGGLFLYKTFIFSNQIQWLAFSLAVWISFIFSIWFHLHNLNREMFSLPPGIFTFSNSFWAATVLSSWGTMSSPRWTPFPHSTQCYQIGKNFWQPGRSTCCYLPLPIPSLIFLNSYLPFQKTLSTWTKECNKVSTPLLLWFLHTVYFIHLLFGNTIDDFEQFIMLLPVSVWFQ